MKIRILENTGQVYITNEYPKELYVLGRIGAKVRGASVFGMEADKKEVQMSLEDLINKLAE